MSGKPSIATLVYKITTKEHLICTDTKSPKRKVWCLSVVLINMSKNNTRTYN